MHLGMSQAEADGEVWRGTDEGGKLKEAGITHWDSPNTGATNESGFTALPGGYRYINGYFHDVDIFASFWSSTEYDDDLAWYRGLRYEHSDVARRTYDKRHGFSVRCVEDD